MLQNIHSGNTAALDHLLEKNRTWSEHMRDVDAQYFESLAYQQTPEYMWIGCADSRVPANELIGLRPGEVFVHRNVANLIVHSDLNCLSAMQFAVDVLKVKHLIICGHYGCGGVRAAMGNNSYGVIDNWIRHIKGIYRLHKQQLDEIEDESERFNKFVEINTREQVLDLAKTSIVQNAWKIGQELHLHGWVYGLNSGYVTDLDVNFSSNDDLDDVYQLYFS